MLNTNFNRICSHVSWNILSHYSKGSFWRESARGIDHHHLKDTPGSLQLPSPLAGWETRGSGQVGEGGLSWESREGKQRAGDQVPTTLGLSALKRPQTILFCFIFFKWRRGELNWWLQFLFFLILFIYYFISDCAESLLLQELFSNCSKRGLLSSCCEQTSRRAGFSPHGARALGRGLQ